MSDSKEHLTALMMPIAFVLAIFVVLPGAFWIVVWSFKYDWFLDAMGAFCGTFFALWFAYAIRKGLKERRAMQRIEEATHYELRDGWTFGVLEEHFGRATAEVAREYDIWPDWYGEMSIQSVIRKRHVRAGLVKDTTGLLLKEEMEKARCKKHA